VHAAVIEALPAAPLRAPSEAREVLLAAVDEDVVLAGHREEEKILSWWRRYNEERPHSSPGVKTPKEFAEGLAERIAS